MNLVIVESPAKAKTIEKYLGKDYKVLASFGHVRDLPSKNGSVDPDDDFAMSWSVDTQSKKRIKDIENALDSSDKLILATDPDREGEAISWHLLEVLSKKKAFKGKPVERVVFNAITKKSVTDAIAKPRQLDMELVEAYLARRALDYLVGFTLSPVLWRKLPGARSAGRVQSVALRLICERETEIEKFDPQEYWTVEGQVKSGSGDFPARLVALNGEKLEKFTLNNEALALKAKAAVEAADLSIESVEAKPITRNPYPPFTTSTLQQDASRKLGFSATQTMQTAQRLYEGIDIGGETTGLITYMRTDGISMVGEAISDCRAAIASNYGDKYLPGQHRVYISKAKNAQEAHEAIRPTSFSRTPESLRLQGDQKKLYELIWKRAMASQMESAILDRTTVTISDRKTVELRATGQIVRFDGFLKVYGESKKKKADGDEDDTTLPPVKTGDNADATEVSADQHFTQPPPRYSEASLVKKMEELGIGRPSTYASILKVLQDRGYVNLDKRRFTPDDKGRLLTAFLENFFGKYVQYNYTADLEERLDLVSSGDLEYKKLLEEFWKEFSASVHETKDLRITHVLDALNDALRPLVFPPKEDGSDPRKCPSCDDGELSLKLGKFGAFVGCSNYPECKMTRPFGQGEAADAQAEDKILGVHPETGKDIVLKTGRFGPYVEMETEKKPKRTSLPKTWSYDAMDLEKGLRLIDLPRKIGSHPEDGNQIITALGRFGPYIKHNTTYVNLPDIEDMWEVGLNRAVDMIADKIANPSKRSRGGKVLKDLGKHPSTEKPVQVMEGRYGPYVKYEKVNATIPKGQDPQEVTMEMAVEYIAAKEAKGTKKKKAPAKKKTAAKKKPAAKKTAAKKPAAKKKASAKKKPAAKK